MVYLINSKKIISATLKNIKISPTKINKILLKIRGKNYKEAMTILSNMTNRISYIIWQTLYSSISNAANNHKLKKDNLIIYKAYANLGPILKRIQPRAKGRAFKIQKKTSYVTISVCKDNN